MSPGSPAETPTIAVLCDHLMAAWWERVQAIEAATHGRFGFNVTRREETLALCARHWPLRPWASDAVIHRIFNYVAPDDDREDSLLAAHLADHPDLMAEVLPGAHEARAAAALRQHGLVPQWQVPWMGMPIDQNTFSTGDCAAVERLDRSRLGVLADVLVQGYGYQGAEAAAWKVVLEQGYGAPAFACFMAHRDGDPAAVGVVHVRRGYALVDGVATLPKYRGRGLQKQLVMARIRHAAAQGARFAFSRTSAGSISQANLQKLGMSVLGLSTAWRRPPALTPR